MIQSQKQMAVVQVREQMRQAKSTLQILLQRSGPEISADHLAKPAIELEDQDHTCIICMDAPRSGVAFLPCGHAVVCPDCSRLVMASNALCPMCREPIQQISA